jgi:hypothetical protein
MNAEPKAILEAAAGGNATALEFLHAFARRAHWVDDLADADREQVWRPADYAARETEWLLALAGNAFFLAHRAQLVPVMVLGLRAWADSAKFPREQEAVLKGQWHETVWCVAWLTGGWDRLSKVTAKCRAFDVEPEMPGANGKEIHHGLVR